MIGAILVIAIIVLFLMNLAGQAAATSNLKRENRESMRRANENWERFERDLAKKTDTYYDPISKSRNDWFYGDGSAKQDPYTGKTYPRGKYRALSNGMDCHLKQVGPNVERAPRD